MSYVKLDTRILDSTLWTDRDCREIFITALLMAEPQEYPIPIAQWRINDLQTTGWEAPAGWYGFVPAAGIGIIRRAGIGHEAGMRALERLGEPELDSRNPEYEGRRMIRVTDGYLILNYMRFRDKDHTAKDRMQRLRERRMKETALRRNVTSQTRNVTQSDADADADKAILSLSSPIQGTTVPVDNFEPKESERVNDSLTDKSPAVRRLNVSRVLKRVPT